MSDTNQPELSHGKTLCVCLPLPPPWDWPVGCPCSQNTAWALVEEGAGGVCRINCKDCSNPWSWQTPVLFPHESSSR